MWAALLVGWCVGLFDGEGQRNGVDDVAAGAYDADVVGAFGSFDAVAGAAACEAYHSDETEGKDRQQNHVTLTGGALTAETEAAEGGAGEPEGESWDCG